MAASAPQENLQTSISIQITRLQTELTTLGRHPWAQTDLTDKPAAQKEDHQLPLW